MVKFNKVLYFMLLFLSFSCQEKKQEVIHVSDIITESDRYKESGVVEANIDSSATTEDPVLNRFISNDIEVNSVSLNQRRMIPEQFGALRSEKYTLNRTEDTIEYYNWQFEDSLHTMNTFFNWMDNFGIKGRTIKIGEEKNLQTLPFLIFVGDTNIVFIESTQNLEENQWENYLEAIGMNKWHYFLKQNQRSKVRWFEFIAKEKVRME